MQKLILQHDDLLKGSFKPGKINFLLVFQVNCPGCFMYAIPVVNQLYREFNNQVSFLGLSTAFEDFDLNTSENTMRLLLYNEVVGETKKAFLHQKIKEYPFPVEFPVAMDAMADSEFDYESGAETICHINPTYKIWSEFDQKALKEKVVAYLENLPALSLTFTLNQLKGTPSIVVFNEHFEILSSRFGHFAYDILHQEMEEIINQFD